VPRQITAFSNPLVKQARSLRDKKHRRAERLFLAEGLRILTEARETGVVPERLFFSDAAHPLLQALIAATEAAGGEAIETSQDVLHKISGKDNPQTVIGIYRVFDTALQGVDRSAAPLWIVAQALRDPGNLGTILRTGDAVGAGGLILIDECADPFSVEAVRASMGALFTQNSSLGCAAGRGSSSVPASAPPPTIRTWPMRRQPSSSSATNRRACPRLTRPNAIIS
jgi:TrmH family RNA methyltransferase